MDLFSPKHLLIVLLVVLLVFGTKKLRTIGSDLGQAYKGFKDSMKEGEREQQSPPTAETRQLTGEDKASAAAPAREHEKTSA